MMAFLIADDAIRYEKVDQDLTRVTRSRPRIVSDGLAQIFRIGRDFEVKLSTALLELIDPEDQSAPVLREANALKKGERLSEAEQSYIRVITRFSSFWGARIGLGEVLEEMGRLKDAASVYKQAVQDFPENLAMRMRLAELLKNIGRLPDAESVYRQAIHAFPDDLTPRKNLAELLKAIGKPEAEPTHGDAIPGLGEREAGTARLEEAIEAYRSALLERTRERVPADWATIQNNLERTLQSLEDRGNTTNR